MCKQTSKFITHFTECESLPVIGLDLSISVKRAQSAMDASSALNTCEYFNITLHMPLI